MRITNGTHLLTYSYSWDLSIMYQCTNAHPFRPNEMFAHTVDIVRLKSYVVPLPSYSSPLANVSSSAIFMYHIVKAS
jgi:hypothetical protein